MRILNFASFRSHTNELFKKNNILKLDDIIKIEKLKIIFEFKRNNLPNDLNTLFLSRSSIQQNQFTRNLGNDGLFVQRNHTKTHGTNSLKHSGTSLWNDFINTNVELSKFEHVSQFNRFLKKHYISCYDKTE